MCKRTAAVSETLLKALKLKVAQCKELKPEIRTHDVYCIAKVCILKNQENMIFMLNNGYTEIAHFPCEKFLGVGIPNLNYISPAIADLQGSSYMHFLCIFILAPLTKNCNNSCKPYYWILLRV